MAVTRVSGVWSSKCLFTSGCLPLLVAALCQLQFPGTELLLLAFTTSAVRRMLGTAVVTE